MLPYFLMAKQSTINDCFRSLEHLLIAQQKSAYVQKLLNDTNINDTIKSTDHVNSCERLESVVEEVEDKEEANDVDINVKDEDVVSISDGSVVFKKERNNLLKL